MIRKRMPSVLILGLMAWSTASFAQGITHYVVTGVVAPSAQDDFHLFDSVTGQKFTARLDVDPTAFPSAAFTQDGTASWYSWVLFSPEPQGFSVTLPGGVTLSTHNAAHDP